jgi:MFS family permease
MAGSPVRLLSAAFVALTLSDLAYFTASGVLISTTPLFVTTTLGSSEAGVGLAIGSFSVTTLVLRPLVGRWVDRRGRRPLLVGGAALFAVLVLGHYVVPSLAGLVVLRLLLGAAEAAYFVAGFAALADLAPPGRSGEALSVNSLALFSGLTVGPVLGELLMRAGGFGAAWAGAAALAGAAAALAARVPETRPVAENGAGGGSLVHRAGVLPGLALFGGVAASAGFLAFAVLRARVLGVHPWSSVLVVYGATVVLCRTALSNLSDRFPPVRVAAGALVTSAVGLLAVGAVRTPAGLFAGSVLLGVGTAFVTPAVFAAVMGALPPSERGRAAATMSIFIDLGLSAGPLLVGFVAAATTIPVAIALLAGLPMLGAALLSRGPRGRLTTA